MKRPLSFPGSIAILLASLGCDRPDKWEVTVENRSLIPCSFFVSLSSDHRTSVAQLLAVEKGKPTILISGTKVTDVMTVKVVRHGAEKSIMPSDRLQAGKRYRIVVDADGQLAVTTVDK